MAALLLLALLALLPAAAAIRKCCPQAAALTPAGHCTRSPHTWIYGNLSYGLPHCPDFHLVTAVAGANASCIDTNVQGSFVVAALCPFEDDSAFEIPQVNGIRKCCPHSRKYDSTQRSCQSDRITSDPRILTQFLNVVMSGSPGLLDLSEGAPNCSSEQVLVDYLVPDVNVWRAESESIHVRIPGQSGFILNPEDVCIDLTERFNVLVVRACRDGMAVCRETSCLSKCCPEGEWYEDIGSCGPANQSLESLTLYDVSEGVPVPLAPTLPVFVPAEPCARYRLVPEENPDELHYLTTNGSLYLPMCHKMYSPHEYCVERTFMNPDQLEVFVCFSTEALEEDSGNVAYVTFMMLCSSICLFLTFIVYTFLPAFQNLHGKTLLCQVASLMVGYSSNVVAHFFYDSLSGEAACLAVGYLNMFGFLSAFLWLNVISFDIWWTFGSLRRTTGKKKRERRRFYLYLAYAWGQALAITLTALVVDRTKSLPPNLLPNIGKKSCWFDKDSNGILLFFYVPSACCMSSNLIFFILTARHCVKVKNELHKIKHNEMEEKRFKADKNKLAMTGKLFVVMGITWALEVMSAYVLSLQSVFLITDILNALQGVFIFIIYVLKPRVYFLMKNRIHGLFKKQSSGHRVFHHHHSASSSVFTTLSSGSERINPRLTKSASDLRSSTIRSHLAYESSASKFRLQSRSSTTDSGS